MATQRGVGYWMRQTLYAVLAVFAVSALMMWGWKIGRRRADEQYRQQGVDMPSAAPIIGTK